MNTSNAVLDGSLQKINETSNFESFNEYLTAVLANQGRNHEIDIKDLHKNRKKVNTARDTETRKKASEPVLMSQQVFMDKNSNMATEEI